MELKRPENLQSQSKRLPWAGGKRANNKSQCALDTQCRSQPLWAEPQLPPLPHPPPMPRGRRRRTVLKLSSPATRPSPAPVGPSWPSWLQRQPLLAVAGGCYCCSWPPPAPGWNRGVDWVGGVLEGPYGEWLWGVREGLHREGLKHWCAERGQKGGGLGGILSGSRPKASQHFFTLLTQSEVILGQTGFAFWPGKPQVWDSYVYYNNSFSKVRLLSSFGCLVWSMTYLIGQKGRMIFFFEPVTLSHIDSTLTQKTGKRKRGVDWLTQIQQGRNQGMEK